MKKLFIIFIAMHLPMLAMGQEVCVFNADNAMNLDADNGTELLAGTVIGETVPEHIYSVIGTIEGNWDTDADMEQGEDGLYFYKFENVAAGDYEFKIRQDHNWAVNWGSDFQQDGPSFQITVHEDNSIVTIYFDVDKHEIAWSIPGYDKWTVAGDEMLLGIEWIFSSKINQMRSYDDENYTLTKANLMLPKGSYEYKVFNNNATQESYPNDNATLVIDENAQYTVVFTFNANTKEVSATATKTDGIYYNYITKGKIAEVIQNPNGYKGKIIIPEKVTHEGVEYTVKKINDSAFSGCGGLTSITIPNSVTSIGYYAFYGCTSMSSITIPNSVTSIGADAFECCTGLTSITLPNSITRIESCVFENCTGLTSITIPNSVTSIYGNAFQNCSGLTSVTIPNSITSIENCAFESCTGLTSITIPNSVTSIGGSAFQNCSGLTSVTIPNSVTSIGGGAFKDCI